MCATLEIQLHLPLDCFGTAILHGIVTAASLLRAVHVLVVSGQSANGAPMSLAEVPDGQQGSLHVLGGR